MRYISEILLGGEGPEVVSPCRTETILISIGGPVLNKLFIPIDIGVGENSRSKFLPPVDAPSPWLLFCALGV